MMMIMLSIFFFLFILVMMSSKFIQLMFKILLFINLISFFFMMNFEMFFFNKIYFDLAIDLYSFGLISLTFWIFILMVMVSNKFLYSYKHIYYMNLMIILMFLIFWCFSSMNLYIFYVCFESSLLPIFFLILNWGNQPERIEASIYMMMYTLCGSLPLLISLIYIDMKFNSMSMNMIILKNCNLFMYMALIMGFLIKMPMYFFHLWLPKAHVESPIMGSMILAGIMLKLGSYGLLRIMFIMSEVWMKYNSYIVLFSLVGGIYSSMNCLCQNDMKMLVAYSSIVHMSILMSSMMTFMGWGISGGFLMMIAHGLTSSGMFCLVNLMYERWHSRSLFINKGLINLFPSLTLMWFLICSSNLSFPPSLNLFSEIMLFNSLIIFSKKIIFISMMIIFLSSMYNLFFYSYSQHGKNLNLFMFENIKIMEFLMLMLHWIPLNFMFNWMYIY